MKKPFEEKEEEFVLFGDMVACLRRHFRKIILISLLFACIGLCFRLFRPLKYEIRSTFKEFGMTSHSSQGFLKELFHYFNMIDNGQGYNLIKSRCLFETVIKKLNLQASVREKNQFQVCTYNALLNWRAEKKKWVLENDNFVFDAVHYAGEKTKTFHLVFLNQDEFEIRSQKSKFIIKGKLKEQVSLGNASLTLNKPPKKIKLGKTYLLTIRSVTDVFFDLIQKIEIEPCLKDPSIYEFKLKHPNREIGKQILNTLMDTYRNYLCEESDRISHEQIDYLETRKEELSRTMNKHLMCHVEYLKENLDLNGFLNLNSHLQLMSCQRQSHLDKLSEINFQAERLYDYKETILSGELANLQRQSQGLKKERDSMDLAFLSNFSRKSTFKPPYVYEEGQMVNYLEELGRIEKEEEKLGKIHFTSSLFPNLLNQKQAYENERLKLNLVQPPQFVHVHEKLTYIQTRKAEVERTLTGEKNQTHQHFLSHELRLLSLQESILKEKMFYPEAAKSYQGVDLGTARALYRDYLSERDRLEAKIKQLEFSKRHLGDPDFEFISLTEILPDSISQKLALSIGELSHAMRDKRNLTERELERLQKKHEKLLRNLQRHIDQTLELSHLQTQLFEEKITRLQTAILNLLSQEISLIDQQMDDRIKQEKKTLDVEKSLITNRLKDLEEELKRVPDRWLKEQHLHFTTEMNLNILENMVKLVESKNVEHNLVKIQSKPIDQAYTENKSLPPYLKMFSMIGFFVGFIAVCLFVIFYEFWKGFPVTLRNLKMQGRNGCGQLTHSLKSLSKVRNGDLKTLRELSSLLAEHESAKVMTIITSHRPSYAPSFAELLAKEGKKILLIDFDRHIKPGLFAYLSQEIDTAPIEKGVVYDSIGMGSRSLFTIEWMKHDRFKTFLTMQKKHYDLLLVSTASSPDSAEGRFFMSFSDILVLTVGDFPNEAFRPYYAWEDTNLEKVLAFVSC